MEIKEVTQIIAQALKDVNNVKGSVFRAQRAALQYAKEHNNWSPMSRLIVGLHNGKLVKGRDLLVFILETCGAKNGAGGSLGWNEKRRSLFVRQDKEVSEKMFQTLSIKPFWEHRRPQALSFTEIKIMHQAMGRIARAKEKHELKTELSDRQVDDMLAELGAVLAKYGQASVEKAA